ncbi:MAG: hypothetical protein ACLP25_18290, partial [Roseiarcus sp.]
LQLGEARVPGVGLPPRRPVRAKDVGDLEARPRHAASGQAGGVFFVSLMSSRSSGLMSRTGVTSIIALAVAAIAVASAVLLILDLSNPYSGVFRASPAPLEQALAVMGKE